MQRNMDLIRDILLRVEGDPMLDGAHGSYAFEESDFPAHSPDEIAYHVNLLLEDGFLKPESYPSQDTPALAIERLTSAGHDFLDNIRNDDIWSKIKARLAGLGGVSLTIVAALAEAEIKKRLSLGN